MSFKQAVSKFRNDKRVTHVPPGWSTTAMVAKELSVSHSQARFILLGMVRSGAAERKRIIIHSTDGIGARGYAYRVVKK